MVTIQARSKFAWLAFAGVALLLGGGLVQATIVGTGTKVTFSVSASGTGPLTYQWQKNGATIPGATGTSYIIPWAQVTPVGSLQTTDTYAVTVSNSVAPPTTATTTLTVNATPANDTFALAKVIVGPSAILRGTNIAAAKEAGEPNHGGNAGGSSVWWKWTAPASGRYIVDTVGSNFDTVLGVYTGSFVSALTAVTPVSPAAWADDISGSLTTSSLAFQAVSGVAYYIAVDGKNGATGAILLQLTTQSDFLPPYPVTTLAGTAGVPSTTDGTGAAARFHNPAGVALDSAGNLYVADSLNHTIRMVTPAGVVSTLAGAAGTMGSTDATGTAAKFNTPKGVAIDSSGNIYVADAGNNTIRLITMGGVVTTLAGSAGVPGTTDGVGTLAHFTNPSGIAVDTAGNIYVADAGNHTIRMMNPGGGVTTLAGVGGVPGNADGTGGAARFNTPTGVAADGAGNVYVADSGNSTIRRIAPGGVVTTLAGTAGSIGTTDGSAALFNAPSGVAVDTAGNVFVADYGNHTIRFVTTKGVVSTIAGLASSPGSTNGTGSAARFFNPRALAVDATGNVFVADYSNHTMRKSALAVAAPVFTSQPVASQTGMASTAVTLSGAAGTGWPAVSLQWYHNGVLISGATNATLTLANLLPTDAGSYTLVASNSSGNVTSNAVTVTVTGAPPNPSFTADFDGDGKADLFWSNTATGDRYVWLMSGGAVTASVFVGTVPPQWIAATGDFDGDGKADLLWSNTANGDRYVWLMSGGSVVGSIFLGTVPPMWTPTTGDFDGDGKADILWSNTANGDRYMWLMNGGTVTSNIFLGTIPPSWIPVTGDFDGDGKTDILWSNTANGDRYIWLMNGGIVTSNIFLGNIGIQWAPTTGDFNGDGKADLLWSNFASGDRYIWLMNGGSATSSIFFGTVPTQWMATTGDFDGDGKKDLVWSNTAIGDRYLWLMNGGSVTANIFLGTVPIQWAVGN